MASRAWLLSGVLAALTGLAPCAHASPRPPAFSRLTRAEIPAFPDPTRAPAMIDGGRQVRWLHVEGNLPFAPPARVSKKRPPPPSPNDPIAPWDASLPQNSDPLSARSASWGEVDLEESLGRKPAPPASKNAPSPLFQEVSVQARGPGCLRPARGMTDLAGQSFLSLSYTEGVLPLQFERVVYTDTGARLDVAQVWLDTRTLGVQPITSRRVVLTRLLPTQQGLDVWGVRVADGMQVVLALSPSAVGSQRGQYNAMPCSFASTRVLDVPGGHQSQAMLTPYLFKQLNLTRPELTSVPQSFIATVSLSRLSRDPEPLLSANLSLVPGLPRPAEPQIDVDLGVERAELGPLPRRRAP